MKNTWICSLLALAVFAGCGDASMEEGGSADETEGMVAFDDSIVAPDLSAFIDDGHSHDDDNVIVIERSEKSAQHPLAWPITASTGSPVGWRTHPITGVRTYHHGMDLGRPAGTPIHAAFGGTVVRSQWGRRCGGDVIIQHDSGYETRYLHVREEVSVGQQVSRGQRIARVADTDDLVYYPSQGERACSTGDHLHFEIHKDGSTLDWDNSIARGTPVTQGTDIPVAFPGLNGYVYGGFQVLGGEWNGAGGDSSGFVYNGAIYLRNARSDFNSNSQWDHIRTAFPSDRYVAGDWNGNGKDTIGILRYHGVVTPYGHTATFYFKSGNDNGSSTYRQFDLVMLPGDIPLAGDWNGDGIDTWGTYRPSTRTFYLGNSFSFAVHHTFTYGGSNAVPLAGDWDNNGRDSIGVYIPSQRKAYLNNQLNGGSAEYTYTFGTSGDFPFAGRWGSNKPDTVAVFRPSNRRIYMRHTNASSSGNNSFKACAVSTNARGAAPMAFLMLLLTAGVIRRQARRAA